MQWRTHLSYAADVFLIFLLFLGAGLFEIASPRCRYYTLGDPTFSYPYYGDTITVGQLLIYVVIAGLLFPAVVAIGIWFQHRRIHAPHPVRSALGFYGTAILCYALAISLTLFITQALKVYVGAYRPHFFAAVASAGLNPADMGTVCTTRAVADARMSFPSGHSSLASSSSVVLSAWIWLGLWVYRLPATPLFGILTAGPMAFALWVAASRLVDYHHHQWDVLTGFLIGIAGAFIGLWAYFRRGVAAGDAPLVVASREHRDENQAAVGAEGLAGERM